MYCLLSRYVEVTIIKSTGIPLKHLSIHPPDIKNVFISSRPLLLLIVIMFVTNSLYLCFRTVSLSESNVLVPFVRPLRSDGQTKKDTLSSLFYIKKDFLIKFLDFTVNIVQRSTPSTRIDRKWFNPSSLKKKYSEKSIHCRFEFGNNSFSIPSKNWNNITKQDEDVTK